MKKVLFAILLSLIVVIFSNQTAKAYEYDTWCVDKTTYFKWGPYTKNYINNCKELDENFVDVSETLFNKLSERDHRGFDLEKTTLKNKQIFETYYPLDAELTKKKNLERQVKIDEDRKKIIADIEKKKLARQAELDKYRGKCEDGLFRKGFKKGTPEFNNCLVEQEKLALAEKDKAVLAQQQKEYEAKAKDEARLAKINNQKSNSNEANSDIAKTCLSFGYKKGTEKYADCMKDLYLQQNAANKGNSNNSSSSYTNSRYADEMLEIERAKAKALEDSAKAQRNRNQSDALMDISRSLLNNNRAPATTNQPLNCRSVRVGNTLQTQCY
jgi:hypothetical protein